MLFPPDYYICYITNNNNIIDILQQLKNGTSFKSFKFNSSRIVTLKIICNFRARVRNFSYLSHDVYYYWLTNDERRILITKLNDFLILYEN